MVIKRLGDVSRQHIRNASPPRAARLLPLAILLRVPVCIKIQLRVGAQQTDAVLHKRYVTRRAEAPAKPPGCHLAAVHLIERIVKVFLIRLSHTDFDHVLKPVPVQVAQPAVSIVLQQLAYLAAHLPRHCIAVLVRKQPLLSPRDMPSSFGKFPGDPFIQFSPGLICISCHLSSPFINHPHPPASIVSLIKVNTRSSVHAISPESSVSSSPPATTR